MKKKEIYNTKPLIEAFKNKRESLGLSLDDVAEMINIPATKLVDWELGQSHPELIEELISLTTFSDIKVSGVIQSEVAFKIFEKEGETRELI